MCPSSKPIYIFQKKFHKNIVAYEMGILELYYEKGRAVYVISSPYLIKLKAY